MSSAGLYIDGDWYTERPKRRILRMARPTRWYWRVARFAVFLALCGLSAWLFRQTPEILGPRRGELYDLRSMAFFILAISPYLYMLYVVGMRPGSKRGHRAQLIEKGKLFPSDHPVVQMVWIPEVVKRWEYPQLRESMSEAINWFAEEMFEAQKRYQGDTRWYLQHKGPLRTLWSPLSSTSTPGTPLTSLMEVCPCKAELDAHIAEVFRSQAAEAAPRWEAKVEKLEAEFDEGLKALLAKAEKLYDADAQHAFLVHRSQQPVTTNE